MDVHQSWNIECQRDSQGEASNPNQAGGKYAALHKSLQSEHTKSTPQLAVV